MREEPNKTTLPDHHDDTTHKILAIKSLLEEYQHAIHAFEQKKLEYETTHQPSTSLRAR